MPIERKMDMHYLKEECFALICRCRRLEEALQESEQWRLHWFGKWAGTEEYKKEQRENRKKAETENRTVPF